MYDCLENKVKARNDGKGDAWANAHRQLGQTFHMQDLDALFGTMAFGQNTGEKLFLEYVPDNYVNRFNLIRCFQVLAMFDRKSSHSAAFCDGNRVSSAFYLWLCRMLCARFFYVIGPQYPPWEMTEINPESGEKMGEPHYIRSAEASEWRALWDVLGLSKMRETVRRQIDRPSR